jgi:hypothetical protein
VDAARYVTESINDYLSEEPGCADLAVWNITEAYQIEIDQNPDQDNLGSKMKSIVPHKILNIAFSTYPGGSLFGATVVRKGKGGAWMLTDEPERKNSHEGQGQDFCVIEQQYRQYCFCLK